MLWIRFFQIKQAFGMEVGHWARTANRREGAALCCSYVNRSLLAALSIESREEVPVTDPFPDLASKIGLLNTAEPAPPPLSGFRGS